MGHTDGNLRLWNIEQGTCDVTLRGHKGAVSALRFSRGGATLASGGAVHLLFDVLQHH